MPGMSVLWRTCDADGQEAERVGEERLGEDAESFSDRKLRCHILRKHKHEICKTALVDEEYVWDTYKEALGVQERRRIPAVGPAIDRRAFDQTFECYNDQCIQTLVCFSCARITLRTPGPRSAIDYQIGMWLLALPPGFAI